MPVLFPAVALNRHPDNTRVDDRPLLRTKTILAQKLAKAVKQFLHHLSLGQVLSEKPDGGGIGHLAGSVQTEKTGKRVTVKDLELNCRVGEIVERLKDQHLEQEHNIIAFGTGRGLLLLRSRLLQDGSKLLPVKGFVQFVQWVTRLVDTLRPGGEVKKSQLMHAGPR